MSVDKNSRESRATTSISPEVDNWSGGWSRSEETWQKVNSILNGGIKASVERRQMDAREFLVEIENRLYDVINQFDTEEKAAILPGGSANAEIQRVIPAINLLTDKQLKFKMITFIDDYRRILQMNREPERATIVAELEEFFKEGSDAFVDMEVESQKMIDTYAMVEKDNKNLRNLHGEVLVHLKQVKEEQDIARELQQARIRRKSSAVPATDASDGSGELFKSPKEAVSTLVDIVNRSQVISVLTPEEHGLMNSCIDYLLKNERMLSMIELKRPSSSRTSKVNVLKKKLSNKRK